MKGALFNSFSTEWQTPALHFKYDVINRLFRIVLVISSLHKSGVRMQPFGKDAAASGDGVHGSAASAGTRSRGCGFCRSLAANAICVSVRRGIIEHSKHVLSVNRISSVQQASWLQRETCEAEPLNSLSATPKTPTHTRPNDTHWQKEGILNNRRIGNPCLIQGV